MRVGIDARAAEDYGSLYQEGRTLGAGDPITVIELEEAEGGMPAGTQILAHGFHRVKGALGVGIEELEANVKTGTIRTARAIAIQANSSHGVKQSREDVRKKAFAALQHPDFKDKSSHELGEICGCTHVTILSIKKELADLEAEQAAIARGEKAPAERPKIEPLGAGAGGGAGDDEGEGSPWPLEGDENRDPEPSASSVKPLPPIGLRDPIEQLLTYCTFTNKQIELTFPVVGGFVFVTAVFRKSDEV